MSDLRLFGLETSISITDTIYSQCTVYNIRLEAYSHHQQTLFRFADNIRLEAYSHPQQTVFRFADNIQICGLYVQLGKQYSGKQIVFFCELNS